MAITSAAEYVAVMPDASHLLSEEPEMESSLHYAQLALLVVILEWAWRNRHDFFIGANLSVYFSREHLKNRDFRGPDFFLVRDTELRPRNSWVVWEEGGKYPDLIIELLSDSTEDIDREIKKELYQDRFRTPEYFWFSPYTYEFKGFRLVDREYREIASNEQGLKWSQVLEMYLGVADGKLRYFDRKGEMVASPQEAALLNEKIAELETLRAERESERAERESERAEREFERAEREFERAGQLANKLRELGIDPDNF